MNSKYTAPEVLEVGKADNMILGSKSPDGSDEGQLRGPADSDLDD